MKTIPTFAMRLLDDVGQAQLAGDLVEELQAGRSLIWVTWQVGAAMLRGLGAGARANPYLTFRAVAVGWIALQLLNGQFPFSPHLGAKLWIHNSPELILLIGAQYFVAGWLVAQLQRPHRTGLVLTTGGFLMLANCVEVCYRTALIALMQQRGSIVASEEDFALWLLYDAIQLVLPLAFMVGGLRGPLRADQSSG